MDIQSLIEEASQSMLTHGSVMPMLLLELTGKQVILFALDVISDSQSIPVQCGILARLGWEECKKYPDQQPVAIGFYAEAWRVKEPENDDTRLMPVKSTKKQEIITIQMWTVGSEPQAYTLPVIRDHKKRVVDVGPREGPIANVSWQVASFLRGCRDSQKPDEEVFSKMGSAIQQRVATMSPAKRQELEEYMRREGMNPRDFF